MWYECVLSPIPEYPSYFKANTLFLLHTTFFSITHTQGGSKIHCHHIFSLQVLMEKNKDWEIVKGGSIILFIKVLCDTSMNSLSTWALDLE